jgi:Tfp pilus assembly protein PilN
MFSDPDPTRFGHEGEDAGNPQSSSAGQGRGRRLKSRSRQLVFSRTGIALAVGIVALVLGLLLGYSAAVPKQSEFDELGSERASALDRSDALNEAIADMEDDIAALEAQVDQIDDREAELDQRESDLDAREQDLEELKARLDDREQQLAQQEEAIEANTIPGDGIWMVGDEVQPGIYKAQGSGSACYWARLSSLDTTDILNNHFGSANVSVEITNSDFAFETAGCGSWIKR